MKLHRTRKINPLLSMTPLIDCVFLLLIFFLLTSMFIEESGLRINLPESASAEPVEEQNVIVSINNNGQVELNGRSVTMEKLKEKLVVIRSETNQEEVVIRADKTVQLELLVKVIDIIKSSGFQALDIRTVSKGPK